MVDDDGYELLLLPPMQAHAGPVAADDAAGADVICGLGGNYSDGGDDTDTCTNSETTARCEA